MGILQFLLDPGMLPFAVAVGIVFGLLVLELVLLTIGLSLLGGEGAEVEAELEADLDHDIDLDADIDADFDADIDLDHDLELGHQFEAELDSDIDHDFAAQSAPGADADVTGALSWLGIGKVPFSIWLTGSLTAFGLSGYVLQLAASSLAGGTLPAWIAGIIALFPGLALGGRIARTIGRIMPKHESSAISYRSYGNRKGVITVGIARRGKPAQARFTDGNGNFHYVMVEPLRDDESLAQGTTVAIVRLRGGDLRAVRLAG